MENRNTSDENETINVFGLIFNSALRRFVFTVAITVIVVMLNIGDIRAPENVKWLFSLIFTDVIAYAIGMFVGIYTAFNYVFARAALLSTPSNSIKSENISSRESSDEE